MGTEYGSEEWLEEQRLKRIEANKKKKDRSRHDAEREQKKREEKIKAFKESVEVEKRIHVFNVQKVEQDEIISAVENLQIMALQKFPALIQKCDDLRSLSTALNALNSTLARFDDKKEKTADLPKFSIYEDAVQKVMKLKAKKEKENGEKNKQ